MSIQQEELNSLQEEILPQRRESSTQENINVKPKVKETKQSCMKEWTLSTSAKATADGRKRKAEVLDEGSKREIEEEFFKGDIFILSSAADTTFGCLTFTTMGPRRSGYGRLRESGGKVTSGMTQTEGDPPSSNNTQTMSYFLTYPDCPLTC